MSARGGRGGPLPPPPRLPQTCNIDDLIRDLQRINLSQRLDQLNTDLSTDLRTLGRPSPGLSPGLASGRTPDLHTDLAGHMEHPLGAWTGLYVRCPDPEPDELSQDPADKKSSSGYSTESASPPESRDLSDEAAGAAAGLEPAEGCDGVDGKDPCCGAEAGRACCETEVKEALCEADLKRVCFGTAVKRPVGDEAGFLRGFGDLAAAERPRYHSVRLLSSDRRPAADSPGGAAGFRPAAASTPAPRPPRSPKTLRFAATAELISPDSPSRRRVASGAPRPGPGILRGGRLGGSLGAGRTYGTGQFVGRPLDPLVVVRTSTDTEESDGEECPPPPPPPPPSQQQRLRPVSRSPPGQQQQGDVSEVDLARLRRSKPPQLRPPRRRLAWLLSCASRRHRKTPPPVPLGTPPSASPAATAAVLFKCNLCKARFPEHVMLVAHVHERHLRVQVRPKYSCGLCPARFYASRFLAKHCVYHHATMGDRRTPVCLKTRRVV